MAVGLAGLAASGSSKYVALARTLAFIAGGILLSACVLLLIAGGRRLAPKIPWALVAVVGSIVASKALDLVAHGVATLGTVPSGLPSLGIPDVAQDDIPRASSRHGRLDLHRDPLAQSAATARAYAAKFQDPFDENIYLDGLSAASLSTGLSGTFVVNGSPTKTEVVDSAGGRSQLAQLTTAACVAIVLLFLTKPLSYMPSAVLSSVVFIIALRLIDIPARAGSLRQRRSLPAGGPDLDYSATEIMRTLQDRLADRGITLVACGLIPEVHAQLDRDALTDRLGADHVFGWPDEVISAYEARLSGRR